MDAGTVWAWLLSHVPHVVMATAAAALGTIRAARSWPQITRALRLGVSRVELLADLREVEDRLGWSELARKSMHEIVVDLQQTFERQEREINTAREKLTYVVAMLEVRCANEYALFVDRSALVAQLEEANRRIVALNGTPVDPPPLTGLPVAQPETTHGASR